MGIHQLKHTLLISCLALLTACHPQPKPHKQALHLNLRGEPLSLDPRVSGDVYSQTVIRMLFEGLTRIGPDNTVIPGLAETIDVSKDGKTYTFHLRDATWSDGTPIVAQDFEYAWKTALAPDFDANCAYAFYPIKNAKSAKMGEVSTSQVGVTSLNPSTLQVELEHPAPYFLELVANPIYSPVPRHQDQTTPRWSSNPATFVSNGPFQLIEWKHDQRITATKNPTYWDAQTVQLEEVDLSMVGDPMTMVEMFQRGEIDFAGRPFLELPIDSLEPLRAQGKLQTQPLCAYYQYLFNTQEVPFNNKKIRQAFAYAINRQEIIDHVLKGGERPATTILPHTLGLHDAPLFQDGSIRKARHLFEEGLTELGLTRQDLPPITLKYGQKEFAKPVAQAIQQQWQNAFALPIKLQEKEWNAHFADYTSKNFQIASLGWFTYFNDAIYNLEQFKFADTQLNGPQWESATYISLLNASDAEPDPTKRRQQLAEAETLLIEEMPCCPIYENSLKYVKNPRLHGLHLSPLGHIDIKWAYFD